MVSSLKTFDASKSGKMTELTQTKHRFGILVGFPYNIAYRKGFGISTGNTTYISLAAAETLHKRGSSLDFLQ